MNNGADSEARTSNDDHAQEQASLRVDLSTILTIVGFSCFWSCFILLFSSNVFSPTQTALFDYLVVRLICLIVLALLQFISFLSLIERISTWLTSRKLVVGILLLAAPVFLISACQANGLLVPFVLSAIAWALLGVSLGTLLLAWGGAWSATDSKRADNKTSAIVLSIAILLSGILCLLMVYAPSLVSLITVAILYLLSSIAQYIIAARYETPRIIPSQSKHRESLFSYFAMIGPGIHYFSTAIIVCILFVHYGASVALLASLGCAAFAGCFMAVLFGRLRRVPRLSSIERITNPLIAACGIVLCLGFFLADFLLLIPLIIVLVCAICYAIAHWNVIVVLSYRHDVLPLSHFARGLIAPLCGFALGWGIETLLYLYAPDLAYYVVIPFLLIFFAMICGASLMPYKGHVSVEEVATPSVEPTTQEPSDQHKELWRKACSNVADQYGLSPRETEVFRLLARGRNAEYINKKLFISVHTVKTHSNRIYRKLGINSQQELISLVEAERAPLD